jgi:ABC-type polysaccharide/polyol phosphate export permease
MTHITIYTPNNRGAGLTAIRFVREIYIYRHLVWSLFARDFRAQFKQNLLGYAWAILTPLIGVFSFIFMNYAGILNPGPLKVPYPVYAFVGTSLWSFLTSTVAVMGNGLKAQSDLIMRTNIPKIALAASSLASIGYGVIINLLMIGVMLVVFGMPIGWGTFAFLPLALPMILLGVGIGLATSVVAIIIKDAVSIVTQGLAILMFFTPVVYVADNIKGRLLYKLMMDNPLTYLVDLPRSILFGQKTEYWAQYLCVTLLCLVVLLLGAKIFEIVQDLVAERL